MTKSIRNLEATINEKAGDMLLKRQELENHWQAVERTHEYIIWRSKADEFSITTDRLRLLLECREAADKAKDLRYKIEHMSAKEAIGAHHTIRPL